MKPEFDDDEDPHYCVLHWCPDTPKNPCKRCERMDRARDEQKDRDQNER